MWTARWTDFFGATILEFLRSRRIVVAHVTRLILDGDSATSGGSRSIFCLRKI